MSSLSGWVFILPMVVLVTFLGIGLYCAKDVKNLDAFFFGSRPLSVFGFACNTFGSNFSFITAVFVLLFWSYLYGYQAFWAIGTAILGFFLYSLPKFIPLSSTDIDQKRTLHEFISSLSNDSHRLESAAALVTVTTLIGFISAEIYIFSIFISSYTPITPLGSAIILSIVLIIYSASGGFDAVIKTDILQFLVMILAIATFVLVAFSINTNNPQNSSVGNFDNLPPFFISMLIVVNGLWQFSAMDMWQRSAATGSEINIRRGSFLGSILFFIVASAIVWIGVSMHNVATGNAAEPIALLDRVLQISEVGSMFLITFFVSAFLSTADSMLIAGSQAITVDVLRGKNRYGVNKARGFLVIIGVIAFGLAALLTTMDSSEKIVAFLLMFFSCQLVLLPLVLFRSIGEANDVPEYIGIVAIVIGLLFAIGFGCFTISNPLLQNFTPIGALFISGFVFTGLLYYSGFGQE